MLDVESSPPSAASAYPHRGPTIHAVEGAVFAMVALAWYSVRTHYLQTSVAEEYLLVCFVTLPLANLLLTAVMADNRVPQTAFLSACLTLLILTIYLVVESLVTRGETSVGTDVYARLLLGNTALFPAYLAVTGSLAVVITSLAAGSIVDRLGRSTEWAEGSVIALALLQAGICKRSANEAVGNLCPALQGIALGLYLVLLLRPSRANTVGLLFLRPRGLLYLSRTLSTALALVLSVLTSIVALTAGTTNTVLPVFLAILCVVPAVRLLRARPKSADISRLTDAHQPAPLLTVTTDRLPASAPPAPSAPPAANAAMQFATRPPQPLPPVAVSATESVLFGNVGLGQTKKLL